MVYGDAQRFWGVFSSILVYQWGGFEIVPGILMTPYFCDGMTMGCFADENDNKCISVKLVKRWAGFVIQVRYSDQGFCFCFFFAVHRYRDGQHSEVYFEHPRANIF